MVCRGGVRFVIPADTLIDIYAAPPRRVIGIRSRVSKLRIYTSRRRIRLLPYRDYADIRWLASQIRLAAGRSSEHPAESRFSADAAGEALDVQDSTILVPENAEVPLVRKEVRESAKGCQRTLSRESNDMGLWAEPVLLLLAIAGVVTLIHLTRILAICLQLGPKAYFHDGVRFVPHRAYSLTNGSASKQSFRPCRGSRGLS